MTQFNHRKYGVHESHDMYMQSETRGDSVRLADGEEYIPPFSERKWKCKNCGLVITEINGECRLYVRGPEEMAHHCVLFDKQLIQDMRLEEKKEWFESVSNFVESIK